MYLWHRITLHGHCEILSDLRWIWPDLREDEESSLGIVSSPGMHSEILSSKCEQTELPLLHTGVQLPR